MSGSNSSGSNCSDPYFANASAAKISSGAVQHDRPSYIAQALRARSGSATSAATCNSGRASPAVGQVKGRSTTPQHEHSPAPASGSGSSTPRPRGPTTISTGAGARPGHGRQSSVASGASDNSETSSPAATSASAGNTNSTPVSSTRNDSRLGETRVPVPYRDDHGLDFLLHLISIDNPEPRLARPHQNGDSLGLFAEEDAPRTGFENSRKRLDELEQRLDRLLEQVLTDA